MDRGVRKLLQAPLLEPFERRLSVLGEAGWRGGSIQSRSYAQSQAGQPEKSAAGISPDPPKKTSGGGLGLTWLLSGSALGASAYLALDDPTFFQRYLGKDAQDAFDKLKSNLPSIPSLPSLPSLPAGLQLPKLPKGFPGIGRQSEDKPAAESPPPPAAFASVGSASQGRDSAAQEQATSAGAEQAARATGVAQPTGLAEEARALAVALAAEEDAEQGLAPKKAKEEKPGGTSAGDVEATEAAATVGDAAPAAAGDQISSEEILRRLRNLGTNENVVPRELRGVAGVEVSALGLVQRALDVGAGPGENWDAFPAVHRQAEVDAALFGDVLRRVQQHYAQQMDKMREAVKDAQQSAAAVETAALAAAEHYQKVLKKHAELQEERRARDVRSAQLAVAADAARAAAEERAARLAALDQVRLQLNELSTVASSLSGQLQSRDSGGDVALALAALTGALHAGGDLQPHLRALAKVAEVDPLLSGALLAAPKGRVLSAAELDAEFAAAQRATLAQSYLPAGKGGLLSATVAAAAAWLQLPERASADEDVSTGGSAAKAVAVARARYARGEVAGAAQALMSAAGGSAAEAAVQRWADDAQRRREAELLLQLINAHLTATITSLNN